MLHHYPPSPALTPYIHRHYVLRGEMAPDSDLQDVMIAERAFIRVPLRGNWFVRSDDGKNWMPTSGPKLFGSNSKGFPLRVVGPFTILGCGIRPSGWKSLFAIPAHQCTDRMLSLSEVIGDRASKIEAEMNDGQSDEELIARLEATLLAQLDAIGLHQPDTRIDRFEQLGRVDSTIRIDDAADEIGLSVRQLERCCLESIGMTPKAFLRRCRFLDTAMAMRGFSNPSAESLAALRYFDQSHLNREFRRFIDMTPRRFQKAFTPLMDEGLRLRHEGDDYVVTSPERWTQRS